MIKLIKNNIRHLSKKALYYAFFLSTVASVYEIVIGKILDGKINILQSLILLSLVFAGLYILSFIAISLYLCLKNNFIVFSTDKHTIYLHFGDLFDNKIANDKYEHKHIVINVNRCFDTIVNNELLSEKTLHGKVFKNLYEEKKFNEDSLQAAIDNSLMGSNYTIIPQEEKPQGNLRRYDVGTVAKIDDSTTKSYFLLAMSMFDKNLNAHTTKQDFVLAIQRLIEYCDRNSQGFPVLMPLLGSGLSRTGLECYSDILRYIINTLRLNRDIINCDYHIYIRTQDKQKINFNDL